MKDTYISHEQLYEKAKRENPNFEKEIRIGKPTIDVGFQVAKLRHYRKISQEELAKKANTHQARISKIENAEVDIQLSTLAKIAYALDANLEIILSPREDLSDILFSNIFFRGVYTRPVKAEAASEISTSEYAIDVNDLTREVV
jgi:transcriptional regulator with XRE-family HTH domain